MSNNNLVGREYRGRYRVEKLIAPGGTSDVYLLHDPRLGRHIVLKKGVPGDRYGRDTLRAIFSNEHQILTRLNGRYAPACFDFFPEELELYMEYCPGRTLDSYIEEWISQKNFPADDVLLRLGLLILEAVQSCHHHGVIVADLKPKNIQIGQGNSDSPFSVTLLDFGSGWIIGNSNPRPSADYSPGYGAPELLRGENPTSASDLYSFGAILFALFARREPSLHVAPRDFAERRTEVHPALQELVLKLTEDDPARRPTIEEIFKCLHACQQEMTELVRVGKIHCPQCQAPVPKSTARFCPQCGTSLIRKTQVFSKEMPDTGAVDPRLRMVECARDDNHVGALFWAKRAFQVNRLPPADRVLALEMALRVPGELDFASKLASSIALKNLENEMDQRKYLVCIGQVLAGPDRFRPNQNQFVHYRELFEQAVQKWPEEELLWCWLYLASEPERQEGILQRGLTRHPESARMRLYLGRVQYQRGARNEALITWFEAVNKGERDLRFLQAVHQLAQEEGDRHRTEVLHRLILATQPQNPQEALKLAEFALHEKRVAEALQFVEQGLSQDPHHPELRRLKAKILFEQQKYELCLELDWVKEPGNDTTLRMLRGRCLYELKRYSDAAQEMADLITKGEGTAETWYYLVRCYQCLGKHDHARQALAHALRFFPNDERLQKLARIMGI